MKRIIAILFVLCSVTTASAEELRGRDTAAYQIVNYGPVTAQMNPRVKIAEEVFSRVKAVTDTTGVKFPRLIVVKGGGEKRAEALKDGSVVFSIEAVEVCFKGVTEEKGKSRLAFLIAHELAHQSRNHFWHSEAHQAFSGDKGTKDTEAIKKRIEDTTDMAKDDKSRDQHQQMKEHEADADGIIFMAMAGYDPKMVVADDGTDFFAWYVSESSNGKMNALDIHHPSTKERAEFVRGYLKPVIEYLDYFYLGVRYLQLGGYEYAISFLDRFREKFPSREVFNNLGLAHYQIAMDKLSGCDPKLPVRYWLSTMIDSDTLAGSLSRGRRTRGSETSACFKNEEYLLHINKSVEYLELAVAKYLGHLPARVNLSSALIMAGKSDKAISVVNEALEMEKSVKPGKEYATVYNNRGVAMFLYGSSINVDMIDPALDSLRKAAALDVSRGEPLYNIAAIFKERKRGAEAKMAWQELLKVESSGVYAAIAQNESGIARNSATVKKTASKRPVATPIRLGAISKETEKKLAGMEKRVIPVGSVSEKIDGVKDVYAYHGKGVIVYAFGDTVEVVVMDMTPAVDVAEFRTTSGEPDSVLRSMAGETLLYRDFAVDVVDGKVVRVVFFEGSAER